MDCENANLLLMKYMDSALSETEADLLAKHLDSCDKCQEDFNVYDEMMGGFPIETTIAPDNFESLVMAKIRELPEPKYANSDSMLCVVWGVFSVLFGLGFLAVINREAIIQSISANPALSGYADILISVSNFVERFVYAFTNAADSFFVAASGYIASSRYLLMLIVAVLVMVQYVIYKKNKVEV